MRTIFFYLYSRVSWERTDCFRHTHDSFWTHLNDELLYSQREIFKSPVYQSSILKVFSLFITHTHTAHTHFGSERKHVDDVRRWPNVLRQNRKQERGENELHSQRFPLPSNVPHFLSHNSQPPTSTNPLSHTSTHSTSLFLWQVNRHTTIGVVIVQTRWVEVRINLIFTQSCSWVACQCLCGSDWWRLHCPRLSCSSCVLPSISLNSRTHTVTPHTHT